jgi:hypothetical protein
VDRHPIESLRMSLAGGGTLTRSATEELLQTYIWLLSEREALEAGWFCTTPSTRTLKHQAGQVTLGVFEGATTLAARRQSAHYGGRNKDLAGSGVHLNDGFS